jgi:hypothetical protein
VFELLWSDDLLAEVERVLIDHKGLLPQKAHYFCDCIRLTFPGGRIAPEKYQDLVMSRRGPDPGDHVHSAAAVAGEATIVLTADKTGYPSDDIAPARRRDPDAYLTELLRRYPTDVLGVVDDMGSSLRQPRSRRQVLEQLRKAGLTRFAVRATKRTT